ncbi:nck-associated protein 5 isoform X3 [Ovis aries]|uniref:NCK associated protein 5 n=1 Tax=Ovis aries TaxID=9940 RepID=A0AC11DGV1_SHEEP|nr:nck-associated protein 5 isoform X3 [Ovis aries]XP_042100869.1 nck-associated protein 5 isoform X3 [Ovis aries]XP_042100870.1 nck-associated protein 5 isoform X3 [Ovis aries]XP_060266100.1 nck-associated protein 5 isoform X3 [Ovis aries]
MEGKRQLEKRDFGKRLSLDSSLVEYMDSNKYIEHLLNQLEEQHRSLWREKLAVARLQREVAQRRNEGAMHEKLIHELEEERHLRLQSEKRLQEVTLESERNRIQMRGLQQQFSRMEETVRNLLQSQGPPEQKKEETVNIMVYQEKLSEEERKHKAALEGRHMVLDEDSRSEGSSADEGKGKTKWLLERLKALEAENSALALENENQREQYERCLDEVANQVVQALLTQKDLREECVKLKTRVFDLEQQNRTLSILFQQRVRPTSDLLQKLHSRILDLSSGDLISDVERSQSLTHSRTDVEMHGCQLNTKAGTPALKCPGMGIAVSGHLCPRSSYSSSELSLSSTCSEYSSGSSYTWHDGKNLRKRQSSQNWDKRLSIDSSLPSGFASPTDELPPTRIKESHILEGLRKLQKRKVLLEPPSVITKWGYKDCMNSNEGIYSPGIKSSSLKEYPPCKPTDTGSPCTDPHKAFVYDMDSHDEADEDASSLASVQVVPNQVCRLHSCKLTHSVSDSLFGWELNGKHCSEITSSVYSRERPEKLTSCASNCPLDQKLCPGVQGPWVQREKVSPIQGCQTLSLQPSDTDDTETLDELHIDSSDEKSPSDVSATADTDQSTENLDILTGFEKSSRGSPEEEENQVPIHLESRPKTFSFIKQQRVVKRTSSEECITVIFDAEDGEPIEFSSHQTGLVTVTRKEISIHQAPAGPQMEHTELSPQGIAHSQPGPAARDYPFLKRSEEETERNIPQDEVDDTAMAPAVSFHPRTVTQNTQRLAKPTRVTPCQSHSRSAVGTGICQKKSLTKIPTRGKSSPQKSKVREPEASLIMPSAGPVTLEKSPAPAKLSQFKKTEGPAPLFDLQPDSHIPKPPTQLPHGSKMSSRRDWVQSSKSQILASQLLSRPPTERSDDGEPPTRDKHCDPGPEAGVKSPSPPSPPGRSVSLLIRPSYDFLPPPSSAKSESRVPNETARMVLKSPPLKGSSAPVIYFNQTLTDVQGKKPSVAFRKPVFTPSPPSAETAIQMRSPAHSPSSSFAVMVPENPKVSPKRNVPRAPPHQTLGTTQNNTGLQTPKNYASPREPLEILSSKGVSPRRKEQLNGSVSASSKPSFLGVNESPSSQVNSPSSSASFKSHNPLHGCQNLHERGLKTRLPVGLKVFIKSPQLLRKSSTVPGKQEKDSLNEASKTSVAVSKAKPGASRNPASLQTTGGEINASPVGLPAQESLAEGLPLERAMPESLENSMPGADRKDGVENRSVKRSLSSSKPHLKPALGMNGAKARSQSFSAHSGEKPPTPPTEGLGKVRTQIITNTAERGNSLTRQSSSTEGSPSKSASAPVSDGLPSTGRPLGHPSPRQGSLGSTGSSSSQHGSPSKLPLKIPPKSEEPLTPAGTEEQQAYAQGEDPRVTVPEEPGSDHCRCPLTPTDSSGGPQSLGRTPHPSSFTASRTSKLETSGRYTDTSTTRAGVVNPEAPLSPTIEEKVMLCIQENVEKGQVQTKSTTVEIKPKPGPSFASWFGFRRSRLPALSSRKMDVSKTKAEKKDAKGLGFGNKQLKSERKKEKKKPELQCEMENELHRDIELADGPDSGLQNRNNLKTPPDIYDQVKFESRNRPSPVPCSAKDTFMTELLNRVDKKAAQQAESGSNNLSCRSVLKGSPQGSCLTSSSLSTQGNHKKNIKTKADMEKPKGSPIREANEHLQEDEEDTVADSAFQSHTIETNCQMRTLDSGIGTFPLPDSGTRAAGRYIRQADSPEDTDPILSLQPALCAASSMRAQTLEREVPSSADSQGSADNAIVHSTSDPIMTARGMRPLQNLLPKSASSGKIGSQMQSEAEPRSQNCSSFEYVENTMASKPLPAWEGDGAAAETQKLKQVEETREDPENRLCKISLESFNKYDSNTVILLGKEKNSLNKVEGQKEEKEKTEEASLSSSDRPGIDHLESLSDSLYDSFSSCASQGSNDV